MSVVNYQSPWMNDELRMFRKTVRRFIKEEFTRIRLAGGSSTARTRAPGGRLGRPESCCPTFQKTTVEAGGHSLMKPW